MSTKLFDETDLTEGVMTSSAIASVGDIVLDIDLSVEPPTNGILVKVKAREGSNTYKDLSDNEDVGISWLLKGNKGFRKNISGINSESIIVELTNPKGVSGKITLEYTKTTNTNT